MELQWFIISSKCSLFLTRSCYCSTTGSCDHHICIRTSIYKRSHHNFWQCNLLPEPFGHIYDVSLYNKKFAGKFYILVFMHTETQDGKSLLDAHFATSNWYLVLCMKTWSSNWVTRINTARGLAYALLFNLGMKNFMVQLVKLNHERVECIKKIFDKLLVKCGEYYNRAYHITFNKESVDK